MNNTTIYPPTTSSIENITSSHCRVVVSPSTLTFTVFSCILSIFGSLVIFVTFINVRQIRNFTRKLLVSLTVADLLTAIGNLIGTVRYIVLISAPGGCDHLRSSDDACVAQSFITTFSSMASFFWTTVIAVHIFLQIQYGSARLRSGFMMIAYQLLCWSIPGIITITASALGILGSDNSVGTGSWCWIRSEMKDHGQILWMVISGKGWEILCYVLSAGLYILAKLAMFIKRRERRRRRFRLEEVGDMRVEDENFIFVPLVLYVLRIWGTVRFLLAVTNRNVNNVHLDRAQEVLLAFQGIGDSGQAFCNCIVFCLCDRTVRAYLRSVMCLRRENISINTENDERAPII